MESSESNRWLWVAGVAIAMIAIVGTGVAVGMALGGSEDDGLEVAGQAPTEAVPGSGALAATNQVPDPGSDETAAIGTPEPQEAAAFEEPAEKPLEAPKFEEPVVAERPTTTTRPKAPTTKRPRTRTATATPTSTSASPPKKRSGNNLDALMDEVVGGSSSSPKKTTTKSSGSSGSNLPDAPSRGDVKTALQGVSGSVKGCKQGSGGTATVDVTFAGSTGRVSRAKITSGPFKGTPVGACVEKAVKRARVPRFKQSVFKVKFPYRL